VVFVCVCVSWTQEADLAVPLTVTTSRESVVDFAKVILSDQMVVVMKRSQWARSEIHSVADLASQSTVKYCVVESGRTEEFFRNSVDPAYRRMWQQIQEDAVSSRVPTVQQGLQRVLESSDEQPWAFVTDKSAVTYIAGQRCDEEVIVDRSFSLALSMAVPLNSPYRDRLTLAVLEMVENNEMSMLHEKWWPRRDCNAKRFLTPLH